MISDEQGQQLLAIAREAIASEFDASIAPEKKQLANDIPIQNQPAQRRTIKISVDRSAPWLQEPGACFITLMQHGQLRGCIGSLEPRRWLPHFTIRVLNYLVSMSSKTPTSKFHCFLRHSL